MCVNHFRLHLRKKSPFLLANCSEFDQNQTRNGSTIVDASLKVNQTGSKLTCMHVYHFRCYWPSNLVFTVTCVTYVPNLRKIGQKLWSLSWTTVIADTPTHTDSCDFISVQCHALHWIDNTSIVIDLTQSLFSSTCHR